MTFFSLKKWGILTCIPEKQIRPPLQHPLSKEGTLWLIPSAPTELKISTISTSTVYLNWKYIHDQWASDYCLTPTLQFSATSWWW